MKKIVIAVVLTALAQGALGAQSGATKTSRLICTNSANFHGSYYLDITGYAEVLNGSGPRSEFKPTLGFKAFRSWVEPVANLKCRKGNPFRDGPRTIMVCLTDGMSRNSYEAAIIKVDGGLMMKVRGSGVPNGYQVFCEEKEL